MADWVQIPWESVLDLNIYPKVLTNTLPTSGKLVYEYNPFRNYRLSENKYYYKEKYYSESELAEKFKITVNDPQNPQYWLQDGVEMEGDLPELYEKGLLIDFDTDELQFDLEHPVHIIPQYSYDGSVNLILNDGKNIPRLINSRFSATGKNTYEIVDRKGDNDTNIYDLGELFDIDTSLYKRVTRIPKITYKGNTSGGNLKVGNYHFYFKLSDADGNETDFVGESGLVSVFIGFDIPSSIHTGLKNENSYKNVLFYISNIDYSYNYVSVYYSRSTAEGNENINTVYEKIEKKFLINNAGCCNILITGFEQVSEVDSSDINLDYNIVDSAVTSATCLNMLFLANVHRQDIPYEELSDLSLRFLPFVSYEDYTLSMDQDYSITSVDRGYYDPTFIYNKTGYWPNELYRIGIVYILPNGELTPVFNIRGANDVGLYDENFYTKVDLKTKDGQRNYITYDEETFRLLKDNSDSTASYENVKGVIRMSPVGGDTNKIYSLDIRIDSETLDYLHGIVKGFFFVRLKRIPLVLAQGITIGVDQVGYTPCIPTQGGLLELLADSLDDTYVETEDINGVNYITEGFLLRYTFTLKKKSSGWGSVLKVAAIVVAVVAVAAACVFTAGAAGLVTVAGAAATTGAATAGTLVVSGALASGIAAVGAAASAIGVGVAIGAGAVVATAIGYNVVNEIKYAALRATAVKKLQGRNTEIPSGYKRVETDESRQLVKDFDLRIIIRDGNDVKIQGILCPDYEVNQPHFNLIFTGNKHYIETAISLSSNDLTGYSDNFFNNADRHFYITSYYDNTSTYGYNFKVIGVPDNVKVVGIDGLKFRSRAGEAEEAWRYECIGEDYKSEKVKSSETVTDDETESNKKINTDIVRGVFGTYLAFNDESNKFSPATTVNIYIPEYSAANMNDYMQIRMNDNSIFNAISDRYEISEVIKDHTDILGNVTSEFQFNLYRGDCYLCLVTHRVIRNFNDPSAPYNDEIVDEDTWKDSYDPSNTEKYESINLGDVNAVPLGMWCTFRVRSSNNLNIRTLDGSDVSETAMSGHPKGFFPYLPMSVEGSYKTAESLVYNKGFAKSLSEKWNFELPNVPHIKNWFGTRIMYSDIHINDAYKNGFRVFLAKHYQDYTREYGEIVKLISMDSYLICIFEHGVARIGVNEKAVAGEVSSGKIYINTSNVLDGGLTVLSDMFGSQWAESVIKTPGKSGNNNQYVYGVDTAAKKIWRTNGSLFECISDLKVQEFLNNNITLGERELTPKIGIRNVKTLYNAYKCDVLFTFYDNTYGFEEKVWNLCWNELLLKFITFYSWVPSYMENINNIPFSFDRNTSKYIAKLGVSHADNSFADGVTLSNVIINNDGSVDDYNLKISYINKSGETSYFNYYLNDDLKEGFVGMLTLTNRILPTGYDYQINFELVRDIQSNYKMFEIKQIEYTYENNTIINDMKYPTDDPNKIHPIYGLYLKGDVSQLHSELYYRNKENRTYADYDSNKVAPEDGKVNTELTAIYKDISGKRPTLDKADLINPDKIVTYLNIRANIEAITDSSETSLSDAYYNLQAGYNTNTSLIDMGYYESMVAITTKWNTLFLSTDFWKHGQAGLIDIADDIYPAYWYGKQHPFEFECIVVNDPATHKIFLNLELVANKARPESFHYEVIGESYDFARDKVNMFFRLEALKALWQYNGVDITYDRNFLKVLPKLQPRSADLPHNYYARLDTINEIEDYYVKATYSDNRDYRHLSGAEIVYYPNRQEYRVWNHSLAVDIDDLPTDETDSRYTDHSVSGARALIAGNCRYLEDRWKVTINPIVVCYKNEYTKKVGNLLISPENSDWTYAKNSKTRLPNLNINNSPIPNVIKQKGEIEFPNDDDDNALAGLYEDPVSAIDSTDWLLDINVYGYDFGNHHNRKEVDLKDKFLKVRIRYTGDELAVIDFLNTVYQVSFA